MKASSDEENLKTREILKEIENKPYLEPKSIWLRAWRIANKEHLHRIKQKEYRKKRR